MQLTLKLKNYDDDETLLDPLDKWLKTENLAHLKKLEINFEAQLYDIRNYRSTIQSLKESNLNLKEFRLHLPQIVGNDVKLLAEFLQSQHNLVRSELLISSNDIGIMNELSKLIESCDSLREFCLMIQNSDAQLDAEPTQAWNLNNVEYYEIALYVNETVNPILTAEIFHAKGDLLQRINFVDDFDFKLYEFHNITRNFPNLVHLSIGHYIINYSSNDIFAILLNLKKLENLCFVFPLQSKLEAENFLKFGDKLVLPKIKRVKFAFNESINIENARKLMKTIKNASKLELDSGEFCKKEFLYVAVEEMPKLRSLCSEDLEKESESHLNDVKNNVKILVQKHNANPLGFELNNKLLSGKRKRDEAEFLDDKTTE